MLALGLSPVVDRNVTDELGSMLGLFATVYTFVHQLPLTIDCRRIWNQNLGAVWSIRSKQYCRKPKSDDSWYDSIEACMAYLHNHHHAASTLTAAAGTAVVPNISCFRVNCYARLLACIPLAL